MEINESLKEVVRATCGYKGDNLKDAILRHELNLAGLLWGSHKTFANPWPQKEWVKQVAKALNLVLIEDYDDLKSWYEAFNIDRQYVEMLWEGKIIPRKSLLNNLIVAHRVDPLTIYNGGQVSRMEMEKVG